MRANVYFADLNKYFYARAKVFEVTTARPIWQQTVGAPGEQHGERTYSLMTNRFPDHTSLYVRVEDKSKRLVYATYSLGRVIAFDEPHAEMDRANQLHVLQCAAPRIWAYSSIGLDGKLIKHDQLRANPQLAASPPNGRWHDHGQRRRARRSRRSDGPGRFRNYPIVRLNLPPED